MKETEAKRLLERDVTAALAKIRRIEDEEDHGQSKYTSSFGVGQIVSCTVGQASQQLFEPTSPMMKRNFFYEYRDLTVDTDGRMQLAKSNTELTSSPHSSTVCFRPARLRLVPNLMFPPRFLARIPRDIPNLQTSATLPPPFPAVAPSYPSQRGEFLSTIINNPPSHSLQLAPPHHHPPRLPLPSPTIHPHLP